MLKTLVVTVAYNPPDEIVNNLSVDYYPHMIVDNSEQETIWLKNYCLNHGCLYQWLGDNLGIAKALNVGAEYALQHGFDYIVTMDQDSELTEKYLFEMSMVVRDFHLKEKISVLAPKHITGIGKNSDIREREIIKNTIHTMTSGNFVNLKTWVEINGFDEKLFIDAVDTDYYIRTILAGNFVLVCNHIFLKHKMGELSQTRWIGKYGFDVWNHSAIRKYYIARNYAYIVSKYQKNFPETSYYKKIILKMPLSIIFFESNKLDKLYKFFLGYVDFLRGRYGKFKG